MPSKSSGQPLWRRCAACQGLFYGDNAGSQCPAGGEHNQQGSANYIVLGNPAPGEVGWLWCKKCQGLFYGGLPGSKCPAGSSHNAQGSRQYCVLV